MLKRLTKRLQARHAVWMAAAVGTMSMVLLPSVAPAQALPSYAVRSDDVIAGRIVSVNGAFNISVHDDRGFVDHVELHPGTIINPTGLTLAAGMFVTIHGYNGGPAFDAIEIDTPYAYGGPRPVPVYYGAGYWYPGYAYGYGPSFALGFVAGGIIGALAFSAHPCYGWHGGVAVYGPTYVSYNRGVWYHGGPPNGTWSHTGPNGTSYSNTRTFANGTYTDDRSVTTRDGGTYNSERSNTNGQYTHTITGTTASGRTFSRSHSGTRHGHGYIRS